MKRHLTLVFSAIAALLIATASSALAQASPAEAAAAANDAGYYIEAGLNVDESRISDTVRRVRDGGFEFHVVLLLDNPAGGATTFAGAVLDRLDSGTVLVLSADQIGMESTEFSSSVVADALSRANDDAGSDAEFTELVVEALYPGVFSSSTSSSSSSGGGSSTGLFIMLGVIGLLVLLVWWAIRRQKKSSVQSEERMVSEARQEIKSQPIQSWRSATGFRSLSPRRTTSTWNRREPPTGPPSRSSSRPSTCGLSRRCRIGWMRPVGSWTQQQQSHSGGIFRRSRRRR